MQIENVLTVHPEIREAAVIAVPDAKYGEVVGAWIVREGHENMSKEEVRRVVVEGMNPQVRLSSMPSSFRFLQLITIFYFVSLLIA